MPKDYSRINQTWLLIIATPIYKAIIILITSRRETSQSWVYNIRTEYKPREVSHSRTIQAEQITLQLLHKMTPKQTEHKCLIKSQPNTNYPSSTWLHFLSLQLHSPKLHSKRTKTLSNTVLIYKRIHISKMWYLGI